MSNSDAEPIDGIASKNCRPATGTALSRRSLLATGAGISALAAFGGFTIAFAETAAPSAVKVRSRSLSSGWRFYRGALEGAEKPAFADAAWRLLDVPHDWRIEDLPNPTAADGGATATAAAWDVPANPPTRIGPFDSTAPTARSEGWTIGGEGWYRKTFDRDEDFRPGDVAYVVFDGVYFESDVWLNGQHLGYNPYGYNELIYDLTPHLQPRNNLIAVRAKANGATARWYSGAGLYRDVRLVTARPVHIPANGVYAVSRDVSPRAATLNTTTTVRNTSAQQVNAQVRVTLVDKKATRSVESLVSQEFEIAAGASHEIHVDLAIRNPQLWSPDSPDLYVVRSEVVLGNEVVDKAEVTTGVRSIQMSGDTGLLINGKSFKLRGANVHHDNGGLGAAAFADAEERKIKKLKAAGFNAIRGAHTPMSTALLDACDRHGMLVIDELFDRWETGTAAPFFDQWWQRITDRVVTRDRNHPCIFLWSIGNEVAGLRPPAGGSPSVLKYGRALADRVRGLDPSRPITQGGAHGFTSFFTLAPGDIQWDYLDVIDAHYQNDEVSAYGFSLLPLHDTAPKKALLVTETYNYDAFNDWKSVKKNVWNIGTFGWTGWDHLGEAGIGLPYVLPVDAPNPRNGIPSPAYPWVINFSGDFDLIGQTKPQMWWKSVIWDVSKLEMAVERPTPEGLAQRASMWSYYDELRSWTWPGQEGKAVKVRVYTSGDRVRLLLNGAEIAAKTLVESDGRVAVFTIPYRPGTLTAVASIQGREIAKQSLATVGAPAGVRLTLEEQRNELWRTGNSGDLAHVLVEVVDARNRLVPDAIAKISLELEGPAMLACFASANPHYVDSFQQPRRYTYHGQALAVLRSNGKRGRVRLQARADGLSPASISL